MNPGPQQRNHFTNLFHEVKPCPFGRQFLGKEECDIETEVDVGLTLLKWIQHPHENWINTKLYIACKG